VSGEEHQLAGQIANDLREMGHNPQSICDGSDVFARIRGRNSNVLYVANGHLDTVPFKKSFSPRRSGNWLIGPGVGDMKAGIAVIIDMAREYAEEPPDCDVLVSLVPREETDGAGALWHAQTIRQEFGSQYETIEGSIFEPTYEGNKGSVCFGHRGGAVVAISAKGQRSHAGKSADYVTATDRLGKLAGERRIIQELLEQEFSDEFGAPIFNIVDINADFVAGNVIPERASALAAVRTTASLAREWDTFVKLIKKNYGVTVHDPENLADLDVSFCDPDSRVFEVLARPDMQYISFPYFSDQPNFAKYGIPTMLYGPGDTRYAHGSDRVDVRAIEECREVMRTTVREYALFQPGA